MDLLHPYEANYCKAQGKGKGSPIGPNVRLSVCDKVTNLNEISLFTQAYFTMLTTIHESKNYLPVVL